jgi:anti-sigma regulatory factor (Ser/Thr protein kinase)
MMAAPPIGASHPSLMVSNELSELSRVSAWVEAWARQGGLPSMLVQIMDLCAMELVTNIINYAYDGDSVHAIGLNLCKNEDGRVSLEIEDDGRPFDPLQNAAQPSAKSLEESRIGGWGLGIVRHFADELQYRRVDARNRLTVIFRHPDGTPH